MSTLRVTTISNQGGTKTVPADTVVDGTAKAWVNFNGQGTIAIRASFNVTSITDGGVGFYTVNFTTAPVDANYSALLTIGQGAAGNTWSSYEATRATGTITYVINTGGTAFDASHVSVAIFR